MNGFTVLYQGIALLMDQTRVDAVLMEVVFMPATFPSSQTS